MRRLPLISAALLFTACFSPEAPIESEGTDGGAEDSSSGAGPTSGPGAATGSTADPGETDPSGPTASDTEDPKSSETDPTGDTDTSTTGGADCGDGEVQALEECDDGVNDGAYGGCNADCTLAAFCGDGEVQAAEACDDGDDVEGNGCNTDCVASGTVLWTHLFVTAGADSLDDPYFKDAGDVVVHAFNPNANQARTLSRETGDIVENRDLPEDSVEIDRWGEADGYIVRENTGSGFTPGDMIISRYSEDGVEQWSREFSDAASARMAVTPGESVAIAYWNTAIAVPSSADRVLRVLDTAGNETWSDITADVQSSSIFSGILGLSNGSTLARVSSFVSQPATVQGFNQGGGSIWSFEVEGTSPRMLAAISGGRWLFRAGGTLQIRAPGGELLLEEPFNTVAVDFATEAPNGDIIIAGTDDTSEPSMVSRLTPELETLWETAPTMDELPFFEVSGLAVGPGNEVLVTAQVFALEAQGTDSWAVLLAP